MIAEELKIVVRAEVDSAVRNLNLAQQAAGGFDANIKKMGAALLRYAGPAVIAGTLGAAAKKSIEFAAALEKQQVAFETLLGSADKATKLFDEIKDFSASTPFQLPDLTSASQRLLAFGTSADDVIDVMRDLGNAAQGNSATLDRLTNAYGKLQAKGRATLEELNMFTEAGVPIMAALQEQLELSKEELFEYVTAGKVGFEEVNQALQSLTRGEGQFAGMLEKQSETLSGIMSTFKDNVSLLGAELAQGLLPALTGVVSKMTEFLQGLRDAREDAKLFRELIDAGASTEEIVTQTTKGRNMVSPFVGVALGNWADSGRTFAEHVKEVAKNLEISEATLTQIAFENDVIDHSLARQVDAWVEMVENQKWSAYEEKNRAEEEERLRKAAAEAAALAEDQAKAMEYINALAESRLSSEDKQLRALQEQMDHVDEIAKLFPWGSDEREAMIEMWRELKNEYDTLKAEIESNPVVIPVVLSPQTRAQAAADEARRKRGFGGGTGGASGIGGSGRLDLSAASQYTGGFMSPGFDAASILGSGLSIGAPSMDEINQQTAERFREVQRTYESMGPELDDFTMLLNATSFEADKTVMNIKLLGRQFEKFGEEIDPVVTMLREQMLDAIGDLGFAMLQAATGAEVAGDGLADYFSQLFANMDRILFDIGYAMIRNGMFWEGLGLIAASGIVSLGKGLAGKGATGESGIFSGNSDWGGTSGGGTASAQSVNHYYVEGSLVSEQDLDNRAASASARAYEDY